MIFVNYRRCCYTDRWTIETLWLKNYASCSPEYPQTDRIKPASPQVSFLFFTQDVRKSIRLILFWNLSRRMLYVDFHLPMLLPVPHGTGTEYIECNILIILSWSGTSGIECKFCHGQEHLALNVSVPVPNILLWSGPSGIECNILSWSETSGIECNILSWSGTPGIEFNCCNYFVMVRNIWH
jgi:hypothetical protein